MWTCCEAIRNAKTTLVVISLELSSQSTAGHPGEREDTDTAEAQRVPDRRYKALSSAPRLLKSIRGQWRLSAEMGRILRRHGDMAAADNWAWDSAATQQHGLSNEINDVVLGLVSPRRGLSPNSPPKVKERTITQTQIHQSHSLFSLSLK
ncbi:Hypothetical predicted protein [Xyrichtys novacula]|uniref:Uncharacterized protein n=1 Tax=Xyrichtys novacula TaxID=13765 RepID=A0AAV1ET65_XYRNO|nr:Hypothetical predicted protein [Xyrichtys novacula]